MCTLICLLYPISSLSHFYFFSFFFLVHPLFLDPGLADETFLELVLNLSPTYLALLSLLLQQTTFTFTRTLCFCFCFVLFCFFFYQSVPSLCTGETSCIPPLFSYSFVLLILQSLDPLSPPLKSLIYSLSSSCILLLALTKFCCSH